MIRFVRSRWRAVSRIEQRMRRKKAARKKRAARGAATWARCFDEALEEEKEEFINLRSRESSGLKWIPFLLYRELLINTRELIVDFISRRNSFVRGASHHLRMEERRRHAEEESFINHSQCLSNQKCNWCLRCEGKLERWAMKKS